LPAYYLDVFSTPEVTRKKLCNPTVLGLVIVDMDGSCWRRFA